MRDNQLSHENVYAGGSGTRALGLIRGLSSASKARNDCHLPGAWLCTIIRKDRLFYPCVGASAGGDAGRGRDDATRDTPRAVVLEL